MNLRCVLTCGVAGSPLGWRTVGVGSFEVSGRALRVVVRFGRGDRVIDGGDAVQSGVCVGEGGGFVGLLVGACWTRGGEGGVCFSVGWRGGPEVSNLNCVVRQLPRVRRPARRSLVCGDALAVGAVTTPHGWRIHARSGSRILAIESVDRCPGRTDFGATTRYSISSSRLTARCRRGAGWNSRWAAGSDDVVAQFHGGAVDSACESDVG